MSSYHGYLRRAYGIMPDANNIKAEEREAMPKAIETGIITPFHYTVSTLFPLWSVLFLECVVLGMCPFLNVTIFECDHFGLCPSWNVLFL